MKIAFVNQICDTVEPPNLNSLGLWTYSVAQQLKADHSVRIYCYGKCEKEKDVDGLTIKPISNALDITLTKYKIYGLFSRLNKSKKVPRFAMFHYDFCYYAKIALDLRKQNADVVHIHNYTQAVSIIRFFNPKVKIVLHMHCEWLNLIDRQLINNRLSKCDLIIGCSQFITQTIAKNFPDHTSKCKCVYNGVNPLMFKPKPKEKASEKTLLYIGRRSPERGLHVLFQAFDQALKAFPNMRLQIIGPAGMLRPELYIALSEDKVIRDLNALYQYDYETYLQQSVSNETGAKIDLLPTQRHDHLVDFYNESDIFIYPSLCFEAFGLPIVEAMAVGIPVIATDSGGIPEIIDDKSTGILVPRNNVDALSNAILDLVRDDQKRYTYGQNSRRKVESTFTWKHVSECLLQAYSSITSKQVLPKMRV